MEVRAAEDQGMDLNLPPQSASERLRSLTISRRSDRQRYGITTRNYHRNQQIQQVSFLVLLVLSGLGLLLLAVL